jgi:hypothetical protein
MVESTNKTQISDEPVEEDYYQRIMRELKETRARATATLDRSAILREQI